MIAGGEIRRIETISSCQLTPEPSAELLIELTGLWRFWKYSWPHILRIPYSVTIMALMGEISLARPGSSYQICCSSGDLFG
jgi:hypothetical protein